MEYSTNASTSENLKNSDDKKKEEVIRRNRKEALKLLVRDYGKIAIIFHVGISLISLGVCYVTIVSGIDLKSFIEGHLNTENEKVIKALNNSSGFLLAYAIHKLFAPIRLTITLSVTPLLVQYLRKKGILKSLTLRPKRKQ